MQLPAKDTKITPQIATWIKVSVVACLLLGVLIAGYLALRYREFVKEESLLLAKEVQGHHGRESSEGMVGETSGTLGRMLRLPPTASESLGPGVLVPATADSALQEEKDCVDSASRGGPLASTAFASSTLSASSCSLPPALVPYFVSFQEDAGTLRVSKQFCEDLLLGKPIVVVEGFPPLSARMVCDGDHKHLELGCVSNEAVDAMIGPLDELWCSDIAAKINGPAGQSYGSIVREGDALAVKHKSGSDAVLRLEHTTTSSGSFLEVSSGHGNPLCLVRLDSPKSSDVEIDADPDVDAFLLVGCILAFFVARPDLLQD